MVPRSPGQEEAESPYQKCWAQAGGTAEVPRQKPIVTSLSSWLRRPEGLTKWKLLLAAEGGSWIVRKPGWRWAELDSSVCGLSVY